MAEVSLLVNGKAYAGWTSAEVTRGIEAAAGGFKLTVSERWRAGSAPWPIYEEDECTLKIDGQVLLTGYVDKRSPAYSATEHSLSVAGRDKTGSLVDCSALLKTWEFRKVSVLTLAQRVAEPFKVPVSLQAGLSLGAPPAKLSVDPGDKAFEAIERACRMVGLLAVSDGLGGLQLMRPGSARAQTQLVEGENIIAASGDFDASDRFRRYVVLGQHAGSDQLSGGAAAAVRGEAVDAGVRRTARVLVIRPESSTTTAHAKERAKWEAAVRAARGDAVSVTVQGWKQGDGSLWPVNALVLLRSPRLGIDGEMLISQAVYSVSEGGTTTQLTLRRPDAFTPEPTIPAPGAKGSNRWKEIARGV